MRAPTVCAKPGCATLVPGGEGGRCPQHARRPWASSNRSSELPAEWKVIRRLVIARDGGRCTCPSCPSCNGQPCATIATEVDHLGDRHNHRPQNLASKCSPCHRHRTQQQANAGRSA